MKITAALILIMAVAGFIIYRSMKNRFMFAKNLGKWGKIEVRWQSGFHATLRLLRAEPGDSLADARVLDEKQVGFATRVRQLDWEDYGATHVSLTGHKGDTMIWSIEGLKRRGIIRRDGKTLYKMHVRIEGDKTKWKWIPRNANRHPGMGGYQSAPKIDDKYRVMP